MFLKMWSLINCVLFSFVAINAEWSFLTEEPKHRISDYYQTYNDPIATITNLMTRVLGTDNIDLISQFELDVVPLDEPNNNHNTFNHSFLEYLDISEYSTNETNDKIILRGSSTIALAVSFNKYLEDICNTSYDWQTFTLNLPINSTNRLLPLPNNNKIYKRSVALSYFSNVCTVSYSQAFWKFKEWQQFIDWMAMQGINFPLAFTGQEYIWAKTFYEFNFTTTAAIRVCNIAEIICRIF